MPFVIAVNADGAGMIPTTLAATIEAWPHRRMRHHGRIPLAVAFWLAPSGRGLVVRDLQGDPGVGLEVLDDVGVGARCTVEGAVAVSEPQRQHPQAPFAVRHASRIGTVVASR